MLDGKMVTVYAKLFVEEEEERSTNVAAYRIRVATGSAAADLHTAHRSILSGGQQRVLYE